MAETKQDDGLTAYAVKAKAITVTNGTAPDGKQEVVRLNRGTILRAPANHPSVLAHLGTGAIVQATKGMKLDQLTAAQTCTLQGADDDPVQQPMADILPVPAGSAAASSMAIQTV